jgi:hypothetical protein
MTKISRSFLTKVATSLVFGSMLVACKKDEPPPPLPSATAPPPATTPTQLAMEPEVIVDAGSDAGDGGKPKVGGRPAATLTKCCAALQQNAATAPPQNQQAMLAAAGICNALASQGKDKNSIVSAVQRALGATAMPAACR